MTRTIIIIDTLPPTISIRGGASIYHEAAPTYIDEGATATDTLDGDVFVAVSLEVIVKPNQVPATFTLTYTAADSAGNNQTAIRIVTVMDTTFPVISLLGGDMANGGIAVPFGTIYREPGVQAIDSYAGNVSSRVNSSGLDTFDVYQAGVYTIAYTADDVNGNAVTAYRAVVVQHFDLSESTPLVRLVFTMNVTQRSTALLEAAISTSLGNAFVFIITLRDRNDENEDFNLLSRFESNRRRRENLPQNATCVLDFAARDYWTLNWMAASNILSLLSNPGAREVLLEAGVMVAAATETKGPTSAPAKGADGTPVAAGSAAGVVVFVLVVIAVSLLWRHHRASQARAIFKGDVIDMINLDRSRIRLGSQLGSFGNAGLLREAWVVQASSGGEETYLALEAGADLGADLSGQRLSTSGRPAGCGGQQSQYSRDVRALPGISAAATTF